MQDTADGEFTVYDVDNTGIIENSNGGTVSFQGVRQHQRAFGKR